jgi:hypothetical protein
MTRPTCSYATRATPRGCVTTCTSRNARSSRLLVYTEVPPAASYIRSTAWAAQIVAWVAASRKNRVLLERNSSPCVHLGPGRRHSFEQEGPTRAQDGFPLGRAASDSAELLQACPRLKILVTSRALLRVSGEQQFAVRLVPLPEARQERLFSTVGACPSVALFVDRASAVVPDFCLTEDNVGDIVDFCARLDGLPLAIELAAARLKVFRPRGLLDRLDRRLALLTGGARDQPQRHQTLRATILWSTELLSQPERQVFRALGVLPAASR